MIHAGGRRGNLVAAAGWPHPSGRGNLLTRVIGMKTDASDPGAAPERPRLSAAASLPHPSGATPRSWLCGAGRRSPAGSSTWKGLARTSLGMIALAMLSSACLVTSTPTYKEPTQTPPQLLASLASPPLLQPVVVDKEGMQAPPVKFDASILSEDGVDDAGVARSITVELLLDYGVPNVICQPFQERVDIRTNIPAGTLAEGPRALPTMIWLAATTVLNPGCHTITMLASHEFDDSTDCPVDQRDSSQLTWFVDVCDSTSATDPCAPCPAGAAGCVNAALDACPQATVSCPAKLCGPGAP
jgi:hypothetical protein